MQSYIPLDNVINVSRIVTHHSVRTMHNSACILFQIIFLFLFHKDIPK